MNKLVDDERLIYKCCYLYYQDGLNQQQICDRLGISRTTVSRMLQLGKEKGIVRIEIVNVYGRRFSELERQVEEKFSLKEVVIIDNEDVIESQLEHIQRANEEALRYIARIVKPNDFIGVSMGRTLHAITQAKINVGEVDCTFVPVVGGVGYGQFDEGYHSNDIASAFATRFNAKSIPFFAPAVFNDAATMQGFLKERAIQKLLSVFSKLTTLIMGIGVTDSNSTLVHGGYLSSEKLADFVAHGAVGDALLRTYDIHGDESYFSDFNSRIMGLTNEQLMLISKRIGIAFGQEKAQTTLGAIRSKKVNILITDTALIRKLLKLEGEQHA